ncbi:MAG TPA: tripartite tricarboxylate transporter substrate binding protein [Burkholderiales bacterium]|nr:tripartite tricarboxylate transporter substrate binding protein [Burkholderiales bacterium]
MHARLLFGALATVIAGTSVAQTSTPFPVKSIRLIVPFPAGGASDFTARTLAHRIGASWGQQVIVDNRAGATGVIGVQLAAKSAPDGYTVLFASSSTFATAPALTPNLPYDPIKDFAPVLLLVLSPNVLTVHPSLPAQSLKELIQLARAKPGQITYASPGIATASHVAGLLFARAAAINLLHVPYKGGSIAVNDVVAGQVQILFGSVSTASPLVRSGRLRALAVTSEKRVTLIPEVPTIAESGFPGYEVVQWFGFVLPAGAPRAIVAKLHQEAVTILAGGDARESLVKQGFEPVGGTPAEFAAHIRSELAKWTRVFRELGLQGEQLR